MHVCLDDAALTRAQSEGVLTASEAMALEALAQSDGAVPDNLYDAIERLFLWFMETGESVH